MKNQKASTECHLKAVDQFYNTIVTAPALFLFSLNDPMVSLKSIETCTESWRNKGLTVCHVVWFIVTCEFKLSHRQVNVRAWDKPSHVGIYKRHPEEYRDEVNKFMDRHVMNKGGDERIKKAMAI